MTNEEYNISVNQYADNLYRFALKNAKQVADAQDLVQYAFEKLWLKRKDVPIEKAKAYLFTTAYHAFIDKKRKEKRLDIVEQMPENNTENHGENYDLKNALNWALEQLSDIQKQVILLRDYEAYSYKEIGDILSISESQVKVYIFRARKKLQTIWKEMEKTA